MESYKPSEQEEAEKMMTPSQEQLSQRRERRENLKGEYERLKTELKIAGDIRLVYEHSQNHLKGSIGGHVLDLEEGGYGSVDRVMIGTGGRDEGSEMIRGLFAKYKEIGRIKGMIEDKEDNGEQHLTRAKSGYTESELIEKAQREVQREGEEFKRDQAKAADNPNRPKAMDAAKELLG